MMLVISGTSMTPNGNAGLLDVASPSATAATRRVLVDGHGLGAPGLTEDAEASRRSEEGNRGAAADHSCHNAI
ncbi:hypothetical protein [Rhodoplanes azumiensis]|uniref:Uncharacterized protein n=1 Tax=Rhodoplanes azumiensis TaxID=1897628 RepID=A0ABW5AFM6_9BRAD